MVKAKKYVLIKYWKGEPKLTDVELVEEELPPLENEEFLVEAEYFSVDPYIRLYMDIYPLGTTIIGSQIAKILESKNPDFPVGKRVVGDFGWRNYTVVDPKLWKDDVEYKKPYIVPDIGDLSPSLALGILGMPGNTACFGLMEICKPKSGETIVVSGAAGAVGSIVGQIAKNLGLTVIGICGSNEKCKWLTDELGFDAAINYKTMSIADNLRKVAPKGIDCYFDNVGGQTSSIIAYQMKPFGRVAVCGSVSDYSNNYFNFKSLSKSTILQPAIIMNELKVEGFFVNRWADRWMEGIQQNLQWIREGKLHYRETVTKGFENMFEAFVGMLRGENMGKAIVQA